MKKGNILIKFFSLLVICIFLSPLFMALAFAANAKVAKVTMMRGQVKAKEKETITDLKQDDWVSEGALIQTAEKSFVKFTMQDQSQLSLGPNSKMVIGTFPKNDPGLIKLINGQLKSQVTKDPLRGDDNKLIIKTKTAAMGVRGTKLMVVYNSENQMSSTVTLEGEVAMAHLDPNNSDSLNSVSDLSNALSEGKAVFIHEGQFSGAGPTTETSLPQKINPAQFDSLATTDSFATGGEKGSSANKDYQSPVPPNVDAKDFSNKGEALTETLASTVGKDVVESAQQVADSKAEERSADVPPEGVYNKDTGEFAPPAGGFIDLKTGLYIPPPAGSTFDAQAGVYLPPPKMGSFDAATGSYVPPKGTVLKSDGTFAAITTTTTGAAGTTTTTTGAAGATSTRAAGTTAPTGTAGATTAGVGSVPPPINMAPAASTGFDGGVFDAGGLAGGTSGGGEFFAAGAAPTGDYNTTAPSLDNSDVFQPPVLVTPIPSGLNDTTVNINVNVI